MSKRRIAPGAHLRTSRLALGLSLRDVQQASIALAGKLQNRAFIVPASRLFAFERKSVVPNIFRLYTLSRVLGYSVQELLAWYGIPRK